MSESRAVGPMSRAVEMQVAAVRASAENGNTSFRTAFEIISDGFVAAMIALDKTLAATKAAAAVKKANELPPAPGGTA